MIKVENLTKKFGEFEAIKNLNLTIKEGEFYCLLGPNGAGKTTTLKILVGLMKPTKGKVYIKGLDLEKDYLKIKKIIGFIPDTPFLYENLTPCEFLEFVGGVYGIDRKAIEEKIEYYFKIFRLNEYRNSLIKELSHGMRQKIVYISNFLHSPSVYFIDEPLVGLDPYSIHLIKRLLRDEVKKGKTILMCTHILSIAEELADRVGILNEGRLIAEEKPEKLKEFLKSKSLEEAFLKITEDEKNNIGSTDFFKK